MPENPNEFKFTKGDDSLNLNDALTLNLEKKKYKCPKGHEWEATNTDDLIISFDGKDIERYAFCPFCYMEFFKKNISPSWEAK